MKAPRNWYSIYWACSLHEQTSHNMAPALKQSYCHRPDRNGKQRDKYEDQLRCTPNCCPLLKINKELPLIDWRTIDIEVEKTVQSILTNTLENERGD